MKPCPSRGSIDGGRCWCHHDQVGRGWMVPLAACEDCPFGGGGFRRGQKPCVHLGSSTGTVPCSCGAATRLKVFGCDLHGECLLTNSDVMNQVNGQRLIRKGCDQCKDKTAKRNGEPLNIGVLNQAVYIGGAEVWAGTMAKYSRHNWSMWSDSKTQVAPIEHIETHTENWLQWRDRQDVLIAWGHMAEMICPRLDMFAGKVVALSHGDSIWTRQFMDSLAPIADVLAAVSARAAASFPAERQKDVRVIINGVDPDRVVSKLGRANARRRLGVRPEQAVIAYIGRYSVEKNPSIAGHAAALIPDAVALYRCPTLNDARKELAGKPVIFTDLPVADSFAASDVFVLASPSEGCGVAILEAWAAGIPVVCTQVGGVPEIEAENGPLTVPVPIDPTPEQVAAACLEAVARREELIAAGLAYTAKYSAREMAAAWDSLLSFQQ